MLIYNIFRKVERVRILDNILNDHTYMFIVEDILESEEFLKIKSCRHHGLNRLEHSLRVSYYSYLIAKHLKLNYIETARGGLLHDFFLNEDLDANKQKFSMFFHPYTSLKKSNEMFTLNDIEKDIIINHMFPTLPHKIPKYTESWIVSFVDKAVAIYEFYLSYGKTFVYRFSKLYIVLLLLYK